MLRIGIVEDEIDDMVAIIRNLLTLNKETYSFELFPALLSDGDEDDDIKDKLEEEGLSRLRANGIKISHPPTIVNLGALNPAHPSSREKILNYFIDQKIHVLISDSWLGRGTEDKSDDLDVRQESSGWKLLDVAMSEPPWSEQNWKCWLMTKYQREVMGDFAKGSGWKPKNFFPLDHTDRRIIDKNEAIQRNPAEGCLPELKKAVEEGLEHSKLMENTKLPNDVKHHGRFGGLIGKSEAMQKIYLEILRFAEHNTRILLLGEPGTGKNLVAKEIYNRSSRKNKKFVEIDVAKLHPETATSELFGHVKGAFTGAIANKTGLLEAADKGTVFLNEIGNAALAEQQRLLTFFDEFKITKLGSNVPKQIDVRIIAATCMPLDEMLEQGTLRQDFYSRIKRGRTIEIPPLCERKEDIPLLCENLLSVYVKNENLRVTGFSAKALQIFQNDLWLTGNVRELNGFVEQAALVADADGVDIINENNEIVQELLSRQQKKKSELASASQQVTNIILATSDSQSYVNMSAAEIWKQIENGNAPVKGLAQWRKEIGEPKTLELTKIVKNSNFGKDPTKENCLKYFGQDKENYRQWIYQAVERQKKRQNKS